MAQVFAKWNSADKSTGVDLTNGDLTATLNTTGWRGVRSDTSKSTVGKWYWEITIGEDGPERDMFNGIFGTALSLDASPDGVTNPCRIYYGNNGNKTDGTAETVAYGASYATGDIVGVAWDAAGGTIEFFKNNVSQGTAYSSITGTFHAGFIANGNSQAVTANFGATAFTYTPPSGFNSGLYTGEPEDVTPVPTLLTMNVG